MAQSKRKSEKVNPIQIIDDSKIRELLRNALTDKIDDREMFMKGIDYSYYYEEAESANLGST